MIAPSKSSRRCSRNGAALAAALIALSAGSAPLAAQQRDTARTDTARYTLPPITVTATRETRSLFDVPLAVTRVDSQALFGTAGYGLDDALGLVPGVIAQSRYGGSDVRLVIRGFGARGAGDRSNAGTARGVRVLLDGVPETEPDGRTSFDNIDLATVEGIEIIRSNASALWGNASGGVVSLGTLRDVTRATLGVETMAGGFGLQRYVARGAAPLGAGTIGATLVHTEFDGWRAHSGATRSILNVGARTNLGGRTRLGIFAVATANRFRIPGPLTRAQVDSAPSQANATYALRDERRNNRLGRLAVSLEHQLGEATGVSALVFVGPKYLQRSERGTFRDFTRYHVGGSLVLRQGVHVGPRASGTLLAGFDEADQDGAILFYSLTPQGTRGDTVRADKREGANNAGAFAQGELTLGRASVTLGARYDAIAYYYDDFLDPAIDARRTFSRVTPKLGLSYRLGAAHAVYASLGGGVEAPAGNETDPASTFGQDTVTAINPLLEPIRSTTMEVGTKHAVAVRTGLVRALAYDVALYTTSVTNEIVPYRGGRFSFTAGKVRRSGVEIGLTAHLAGDLTLQSAVAWSRNRYRAYLVDSVHYGVPGALADYAGNRVVGVPDAVYAVSVTHAPPFARPVSVRLAVQGMSRFYADDANTVAVPGWAVANLTLGLDRPVAVGAGVAVRGFVTLDNLFDTRYLASAFLNPDVVAGVPVAFEPGLPRRLLISVGVSRD